MKEKSLRSHLPYNRSLNEKARHLRNNPTPAERFFWNALRKMPFYSETIFNRQKPIGNYIADFYCHRFLLAVEIDGHSHGEDKNISCDSKRTAYFESLGLKVIRFANREVETNISEVMDKVEETIREREESFSGWQAKGKEE